MDKINNRRFISFEGIDYSGKSTQINLLKDFLKKKGFEIYVLREPGGTSISEKIRALLLDKKNRNMNERSEIFLYSAARAQLVQEKIIPLLKAGYYVIADRYVDSTTAYQGYGRGIDPRLVRLINDAATFGLMPSLTFLLDIKPQAAAQRRQKSRNSADRLEAAGIDFFERVYRGYHQIAAMEKERYVVLDASGAVWETQKKIMQIIVKQTMDEQE